MPRILVNWRFNWGLTIENAQFESDFSVLLNIPFKSIFLRRNSFQRANLGDILVIIGAITSDNICSTFVSLICFCVHFCVQIWVDMCYYNKFDPIFPFS